LVILGQFPPNDLTPLIQDLLQLNTDGHETETADTTSINSGHTDITVAPAEGVRHNGQDEAMEYVIFV